MNTTRSRSATAARILLAAVLCAGSAGAAERYQLDPVHTRVTFAADHAGFSRAIGTFRAPRGELLLDTRAWENSRIEVELDVASLDLGDADWNARMLKRDFFDAARHPVARFESDRIDVLDDARLRVHGTLQLRGSSRPLVLDVRINKLDRHPSTFRATAGFSATASVSRAEYGMKAFPNAIGDRIELRIEAEATRRRDRQE